ncbi:hypothetical protein BDV95DRAFT_611232 [Massariosphaeria phaeospora]|uniref:Uncharacterized protein n=1 Tax=Massariosphaeria phaeospora TaxID=100035 RepID=A0A7C8M1B7_9PLEO|nr:hypothetical protein BDV95DRAFT_611232 [Massariosphaeria phaeospora]
MSFADMNYGAVPTNEARPTWPVDSHSHPEYDVKMYTFLDDFNDFPATVGVSVSSRASTLPDQTADAIFVNADHKWMLMREWLLSMPYFRTMTTGLPGPEAQRKWWALNGLTFRFMELPSELRLVIYEYVLGEELYPLPIARTVYPDSYQHSLDETARVTLGLGCSPTSFPMKSRLWRYILKHDQSYISQQCVIGPNPAILCLSKQVHNEAMHLGWETPRKCFVTAPMFKMVLDAGNIPPYNRLTKLRL